MKRETVKPIFPQTPQHEESLHQSGTKKSQYMQNIRRKICSDHLARLLEEPNLLEKNNSDWW
jgi:hypothetical protein